eukprot:15462987-Alexandrium_andersonii.AAC.1
MPGFLRASSWRYSGDGRGGGGVTGMKGTAGTTGDTAPPGVIMRTCLCGGGAAGTVGGGITGCIGVETPGGGC